MLERARRFLREVEHQFGVDVRQLHQRDAAEQMERFLKQVYQSVCEDDKQRVDEEIEIHLPAQHAEVTAHSQREGRIDQAVCGQNPCRCLHQLRSLGHVAQRAYGNHARGRLKQQELERSRSQQGAYHGGYQVQIQGRAGVVEHTDDDRHPRKRYDVDTQFGVVHHDAGQHHDDTHENREEQYRVCIAEQHRTKDIQIQHQEHHEH